ncbi:MAG TPA: DUF2764 family protein [Kiritimatiellia bacterium]|nr:DUF2764 family protein [Kiritimatiellia bacterium]HPJ57852.1 DUF2764 family protein [Kiritimatiellia bacterium]HPR68157.1 DUF2764 family protein [Kiritimatiellia bacterium]HRX06774.1 DUF2764 family protein [Kiritimatiellia bacterium]
MGGYTYLVASLPSLSLEAPPPFTPEEFRFKCQGVLSDADLAELDGLLAGRAGDGSSAFAQAWAAADAQIRNSTARARAAKRGVEAKGFLRSHPGYAVWLDKEVSDALAKANPLAREQGLDHARWKFVEELALADAFGLPAVLAFAVKLMLASRWAAFEEEAGRKRLEELVSQLEENAVSKGAADFK